PHYESLEIAVQDSRFPIRLERNVTNMPGLIAWADVAISAGGSTCWELAFMGLPSILLVLAENQRAVVEGLEKCGCCINLGWHEKLDMGNTALWLHKLLVSLEMRLRISKSLKDLIEGQDLYQLVTLLS
ncbi:MAG: glycosyltransferase, partial [Planktothrix sp.]|uniref:glycosyltransferase n=1 Tax=Planktothrix sp. TaxID=3088171 RepID=UPI0038D358A9